jgi:tRNA A-37 threonylcarbamoyl transferase component Bud32
MQTTITLHPKFDHLREYIEQIPQQFEDLQNVLYKDRNLIKTDEVSNIKLVIKSYHRIYLPNRLRYTFLYPSKAERAYRYGLKLLQHGFQTPQPIAFIECYKNKILTRSYFISLYSDFKPLSAILLSDDKDLVIKDLTRFTYELHQKGFYHNDFSNGNILCKKEGDHFQFALIDNNRMKFGKFTYSERLKNFLRLGLTNAQLISIAEEYARLAKNNDIKTIELLFHYIRKHRERNYLKKQAKKLVLNSGLSKIISSRSLLVASFLGPLI